MYAMFCNACLCVLYLNVTQTQTFLLRKSSESRGTGVLKKLRKFQHCAIEHFFQIAINTRFLSASEPFFVATAGMLLCSLSSLLGKHSRRMFESYVH